MDRQKIAAELVALAEELSGSSREAKSVTTYDVEDAVQDALHLVTEAEDMLMGVSGDAQYLGWENLSDVRGAFKALRGKIGRWSVSRH